MYLSGEVLISGGGAESGSGDHTSTVFT